MPKRTERRHASGQSILARLCASRRAAVVGIFVVATAVYLPTLGADFVWDDRDLIVENPAVAKLDGNAVRNAFSQGFWGGTSGSGGYYRPLTTLSYHMDYAVFRGRPWGFHLVNALANATACALVFLWLTALSGSPLLGIVCALFFALHPLHSENVAWISGRTDIFATLFAVLCLGLYVRARREVHVGRAIGFAAGSIVSYVVSLLYKESGAALPLVLLVIEMPPTRRWLRGIRPAIPAFVHGIPFLAVLGGYLWVRASVLGQASGYEPYADGILRFAGLPIALVAGYVFRLALPFRLSGEWDVAVPSSILSPGILAGIGVLAGIVWCIWRWRSRPTIPLGAALFFAGLAPVLNVIPLGEVSAERFAYFASLGAVMWLADPVSRALSHRNHELAGVSGVDDAFGSPPMPRKAASRWEFAFVVLLLVWGGRTVQRTSDWKNESALFAATVRTSPGSARAHLNVGNVARRNGRLTDAAAAYRRAIEIDPDYPDALSNLAGLYVAQQRIDAARELLVRAAEAAPDNVNILTNLGSLEFQKGRFDEAARRLTHVLEIDPNYLDAHFNLGLVRAKQNRAKEARAHLGRVIGKGARFNVALYHLAVLDEDSGNASRAKELAKRFLAVYPRNDALRKRAIAIARGR